MSEEPDKDSKTEEATYKKTQDAIEKGNVATSRELPILFSLVAMLLIAFFLIKNSAATLSANLSLFLDNPGGVRIDRGQDAILLLDSVALEMGKFLLPAIVVLCVAGLAGSMSQNAPRFVGERIRPQMSRISIRKGWEKIFGAQGLVEFGKSLFKFVSCGFVLAMLLNSVQFRLVNAMFSDPGTIAETTISITVKLLSAVCIATVLLVIADLVWARVQWRKNLRMTRQEVKDEHKQAEGDPLVKSRMRSLARDRSRNRMMANIPRATFVLANPTHYAIALRYVHEEGGAPLVIAKGQDLVALKIKDIAAENNIPIFEDKILTRAMFPQVGVDSTIPIEFYKAVAEIIYYLHTRQYESKLPKSLTYDQYLH
jgi:flagellar biosynthetic protein FlhB